jgi:N-acetylmuramic acid 6-phosphate etherase
MRPPDLDAPTEAIHDDARDLHRASTAEVLALIHREDGVAHEAVAKVLPAIEQAVDVLACVVGGGGRWFNVGAGTSGRIGVLDASEIPPTYGLSPRVVQGVIAGGDRALRHAVEGAEDDDEAARFELIERGLGIGDAVVALSASGRTPFALGGVEAALEVGARSIAITCDPDSPLAQTAELSISPRVGPEVVAGSTRMKGGLVQKMILTSLSTAVMIRLGKVVGPHMTHLQLASSKLQGRAVRIVQQLTGLDEAEARALLDEHAGCVDAAVRTAAARRALADGS